MMEIKKSEIKVLVVDDEAKFRQLLRKNLAMRGYEVDEAKAGEEAIAKVYYFDPQVVLLDVRMPRLTGDELVKMIKDWKPHVQVIMSTAVLSAEAEKECLENGAFAYLKKPIDFEVLDQTILNALEVPSAN